MGYFAYILECADKTLYTGCTTNLNNRLHAHNNLTSGARYTRIRRPVSLLYSEQLSSYTEARRREAQIKRLKREEKLKLIENQTK